MAQLSTLPSYAVAAIAKAARAEVSMFENPFYIESPPEPSQYFMLYLYAEMLHISFTQLIVSPTAFLCRLKDSCNAHVAAVVASLNWQFRDAMTHPLAKVLLSACFQKICPE